MCGIVCALDLKQPSDYLRPYILEMLKKVGTEALTEWNSCGKMCYGLTD